MALSEMAVRVIPSDHVLQPGANLIPRHASL